MSIHKYSEGCFRLRGRTLTQNDLDLLLAEAKLAVLRRARICVHFDINDQLQEMFVVMMRESYKGLYRYGKAHSLLLMKGAMDYEFYSDAGQLMDRVEVSEKQPFIKVEAGVYHRPILHSDYVVLYETHLGPFEVKSNIQHAPFEQQIDATTAKMVKAA